MKWLLTFESPKVGGHKTVMRDTQAETKQELLVLYDIRGKWRRWVADGKRGPAPDIGFPKEAICETDKRFWPAVAKCSWLYPQRFPECAPYLAAEPQNVGDADGHQPPGAVDGGRKEPTDKPGRLEGSVQRVAAEASKGGKRNRRGRGTAWAKDKQDGHNPNGDDDSGNLCLW